MEQRDRPGWVGITGGDIGNKRLLLLTGKLCKGGLNTVHNATPSKAATVWTSLSPRPDKLTKRMSSLVKVGAKRLTKAKAWLDSSAGIIPSRRHNSWKAATASVSVATTYWARPVSINQACSGPLPG